MNCARVVNTGFSLTRPNLYLYQHRSQRSVGLKRCAPRWRASLCGLKTAAFIRRFPPPSPLEMPASQHAAPPCHSFYVATAYPSLNPKVNRPKRRSRCPTDTAFPVRRKPVRPGRAPCQVTSRACLLRCRPIPAVHGLTGTSALTRRPFRRQH